MVNELVPVAEQRTEKVLGAPVRIKFSLHRFASVPILLLLATMAVLWAVDLRAPHESDLLLMVCNFIFSTASSMLVMVLVWRSYRVSGSPGLLLFGCGVAIWGAAGTLTPLILPRGINITITTHNTLIWISALCHLTGVLFSLRPFRPPRFTGLTLVLGYALSLSVVWLVLMLSLQRWMPVFFINEQGGTPVRSYVLGSAAAMFALTAVVLWRANQPAPSAFVRWYCRALLLIATGLVGILLEPVHGGWLSWTGRAAQFLGGGYMLAAAVASVFEASGGAISLTTALQVSEERNAAFVAATFEGIVESESGRIVDCNEQFAKMTGRTVGELRGQAIADLIAPEDRERVLENIRENRDSIVEHGMLCKDGGRIMVETHGRPVISGIQHRYTAVRDITERKQAEEQLRTTLESIGDGFFALDSDWRFVYINAPAERIMGIKRGEVLGRSHWEVFPKTRGTNLEREYRRAARGEPCDFESLYEPSDRWFHNRCFTREGGGISVYFTDITESKRAQTALRESEQRFRLALRNAPMSVAVQDRDLRYIWAYNQKTAPPEQIIGHFDHEIFEPEEAARMTAVKKRVLEEGIELHEQMWLNRPNGRIFLDIFWEPIRDESGRVIGVGSATVDLTGIKLAEEALRHLNDTLEQRVAERTAEIRHQADQLRALAAELTHTEQRERKRLASILHDHIQQLLVAARMQLELVKRGDSDTIQSSLQGAESILSEAIDASRSLSVELSPPILHQAGLGPALAWLAGRLGEKHLFKINVLADSGAEPADEPVRILLFESVRELLLNVVKHSGAREAQVTMHRTGEGWTEITVMDKGCGFKPDILTSCRSGFGLFSIQQRLAYFGGSMRIESEPGSGTRVVLEVTPGEFEKSISPAVQAPPHIGAVASPVHPEKRKIRVLLADDHKIMRQGLISILQYEPDMEIAGEAADGLEAVERARKLKPDVIVMDINMPVMSGVEATQIIKKEMPGIQIIGLSVHIEKDVATVMRNAGAAGYITKGSPSEELIAAIRACSRNRTVAP